MNKNHPGRILSLIASVAMITLACSLLTSAVPAAAPTATQPAFELPTGIPPVPAVASPTRLTKPTASNTSIPQPTPQVASTEANSEVMAEVKDYYEKGYLPYENGQLTTIDDFSKTRSSIKVFDFTPTRKQSQDFALWADIELDTTGSTTYPKYTGCGFAYRVQDNSEGYTAILTNDYVRMGSCNSGLSQCTLFGTTHGTGTVDVRNKTKTQFSLAVNRARAYVLVDSVMVGEYTLYTTKLLGTGDLYYGAVSDINSGYWSSCKISNIKLWESTP